MYLMTPHVKTPGHIVTCTSHNVLCPTALDAVTSLDSVRSVVQTHKQTPNTIDDNIMKSYAVLLHL